MKNKKIIALIVFLIIIILVAIIIAFNMFNLNQEENLNEINTLENNNSESEN